MNTDTTQPLTRYDLGYRLLHWLMAFMFVLMLMAGVGFASATTDEETLVMLTGHSSIGSLVTLLLVLRLTKRFVVRSPVPQHPLPKTQALAAKTMQYALYLCMILIPLTGYLTAQQHELPVNAFGAFNLSDASVGGYDEGAFLQMRSIHSLVIKGFVVLLVGHISAALFHGFVKKDGVLRSMSFRRDKSAMDSQKQTKPSL